jgi:hypothetical protein
MAQWALGRTAPEAFCREILQRLEQNEGPEVLGEYEKLVCKWEGQCWLLWWLGRNQDALHVLEVRMEDNEEIRDSNYEWSFWRYGVVVTPRYLDDMQQLRRMIQGEPIRPPFLGDPAEAG